MEGAGGTFGEAEEDSQSQLPDVLNSCFLTQKKGRQMAKTGGWKLRSRACD